MGGALVIPTTSPLESLLVLLESDSCHLEKRIAQEYMRVKIKWYNGVMRKLVLSSIDLLGFNHFIKKPSSDVRAVFITTAANPYPEKERWFVDRDREILRQVGINFSEMDIAGKTKETLRQELSGVDVVLVEGGNTFYLLEQMRKSGFDGLLDELLDNNVIYVGSSAGAVVAGPNIEPVKYFDDPKYAPSLRSYEGLGLVDFLILPHYEESKHMQEYETAMKDCQKLGMPYQLLTNEESILVEGDTWKVVPTNLKCL